MTVTAPHYPPTVTADHALRQHGLNGDRLLKLARRIANDAQKQAPAGLGGKYEDLVSFLTLQALEATIRYNPDRAKPGYTFASYLCDIMERRVPDFYRRKSEGFGDRRSGNDQRVILAGDTMDDEPDHTVNWANVFDEPTEKAQAHAHRLWAQAAGTISTPMHDWDHIDETKVMRWTRAAQTLHLPLDQWIRRTLDLAADHQLRNGDKQAA
jgi:DNA-directed RNA polymerase specialized sigma24 family protein